MKEILNIDCMDKEKGLPSYPDNFFDLAMTDPPYNVGRKYNEYCDDINNEKYKEWCLLWFNELMRISKTVVLTIGYKNLLFWLSLKPRHIIIWHKPNQNSPSPIGGFNVYEPVLYFGKLQKRIGHDVFKTDIAMQKEASWHDCPKHLKSWTLLIDKIINKPAKVIDPFLGSGTTAISCHKLELGFVGFEIDKLYYDKSIKRIKGYKDQLKLL